MELCELSVWYLTDARPVCCALDGRRLTLEDGEIEVYQEGAWRRICRRCARRHTRYLWLMGEPRPGRS